MAIPPFSDYVAGPATKACNSRARLGLRGVAPRDVAKALPFPQIRSTNNYGEHIPMDYSTRTVNQEGARRAHSSTRGWHHDDL